MEDDCLPTADIIALIDKAAQAGMVHYILWGGEPLAADALPEFLARAKTNGMRTVVCTSGYRLKDRAREIAPLIDHLLLSLEAVGEKQDKLRGCPGLYQRMVQGLDAYTAYGSGSTFLWSNVSKKNKDQVRSLALFAREHGIGIEFFPAALYPGYNEDLMLNGQERDHVFSEIKQLKKEGFPVRNTRYALELMRSQRLFKCNIARLGVQVASDGRLYPCEPRFFEGLPSYGHINEVDFTHPAFLKDYTRYRKQFSSCNACLMPCVAHTADSLIMQSCRRFLNYTYYH